jgi:hypothetical protein
LPCIAERLNLPIEACDDDSNEDVLATPLTRPKAPSCTVFHEAQKSTCLKATLIAPRPQATGGMSHGMR